MNGLSVADDFDDSSNLSFSETTDNQINCDILRRDYFH